MFSGGIYYKIYLAFVTLLSFIVFFIYHDRDIEKESKEAKNPPILALSLAILIALFIGFRPYYEGFTDMGSYRIMFDHVKNTTDYFSFNWDVDNILFDNFFAWSALHFDTPRPLFVIMSAIYFFFMFYASRRIFGGNTFAVLLTCLAAFSTFSYGTNGIKAGAAASIFLFALSFNNKPWLMFIIALISMGMHHAMQLCVGALVVTYIFKEPKFYIGLWLLCLALAAFHYTGLQEVFAGFTDDHGANYLEQVVVQEEKGWSGFRIDFIIYSFTPIAMGIYAIFVKKFKSPFYNFLISLYLLTNSIWLLCIYANFTNRIAYLSWFMLPFVLIYPTLHPKWGENRFKVFSFVMIAHLSFTLFMQFVYYA